MKKVGYYQYEKCRPMTVSCLYMIYADICGASLERRHQMTVGLLRTAIFSIYAGYFFRKLAMRPALLYGNTLSVVSFSVIPKCMTLSDLVWLFHVKFCFHAGLAG